MSKTFPLVLLLVCAVALGQEKAGPSSFGVHVGPEAPMVAAFDLDWAQQADLANGHAPSAAWRSENPGWTIAFDPRTRMPWRAFGPGIPVAPAAASAQEIDAASRAVVTQLAPVAGLDASSFEFVAAVKAGTLWYVDYAQVISGGRVFNGGMTLRIDEAGRLVMWGGRFVDPSGVPASPAFTADQAIAAAFSHLARERFLGRDTTATLPDAKLVVHVEDGRDSLVPRLAWLLELRTESPTAWWKVFVDATTGSVLQYWNEIREHGHRHACGHDDSGDGHDDEAINTHGPVGDALFMAPLLASFSGVSNGMVHDGVPPQGAPVLRNFNDLTIYCNATAVTTDALGAYSFTGGPATVPVTSGLDGIHVSTNNLPGPQASFAGNGTTGTLDVVWDDVNSNIAERDAFFFTNQAWNTLLLRNPAETLFGAALPAVVNRSGGVCPCNAYYDGGSINFCTAAGGCINTAFSASVVVHEYGHHVSITIYNFHGKTIPGDMGEGYSDCQSAAVLDSNIIGDGFQGPGTMVRNLDNACLYPASCGTEVHAAGLVIGGAFWHTRVQFANAYGVAGKVEMDEYLYQHLHGGPLNEIESCLEFLLLDDDDANVANGTPDAAKFYQGFTVQHAIPFPIPVVSITHATLRNTMDQLQNYQVRAVGVSGLNNPISTVTAHYSLNGAAFVSVPMTLAGSEHVGTIPVQPPGTTIRYYVRFQDSQGNAETMPSGGANAPFIFRTFRLSPFHSDGFEGAATWTSATQAGANDWHNQAPGNPNHAYDPATAFEGTQCWGNDLSPAFNWNGNYPNNVHNHLTSPVINCTGKTGVAIVYRRWLTVEDGLYDHARILVSNNGGGSFTTVWENAAGTGSQHHIDTAWTEHVVNIASLADNQANVMVRFEMQSDAGLTFGGWNVDAFTLASSDTSLPLTQIGASTPFAFTTIRMSGVPGEVAILVADPVLQPTYYPGVGTLSVFLFSPTLLLVYNVVPIPPSGQLDLSFVVPPASGVTVYLQGVLIPAVFNDLLVTNVLPFTIL